MDLRRLNRNLFFQTFDEDSFEILKPYNLPSYKTESRNNRNVYLSRYQTNSLYKISQTALTYFPMIQSPTNYDQIFRFKGRKQHYQT